MDESMAKHLGALTAVAAQQGMTNINVGAQNATQALQVIQNTILHSQGATTDDGTQLATLQTAAHSPLQGATRVA